MTDSSPSKINLYLGDAIVSLFFLSKIGLNFAKVIPYHIPPFIYQGGMHPYVNILATIFLSFCFLLTAKKRSLDTNAKMTLSFIIIIIAVLIAQTVLQMFFIHPDASKSFQLSGALMAMFTVGIFGVILPLHYPLERFLKVILLWSVGLVLLSVSFLPLFSSSLFRGGRFVGVTKHIPHMVTMSSCAAIFLIANWSVIFRSRFFSIILYIFITLVCFFAVALTATKAAMGSVFLATLLALLFFGKKSKPEQWGRLFIFGSLILSGLLLTPVTGDVIYEVASGERALLGRPAQNGFETRWEEVERGSELFLKSPHLGLGILYKFMTTSLDGSVDTYNSFKDPHNLFLSAGVIAGWPFMVLVTIGYICLIFKTFFIFFHRQKYPQAVLMAALFMATHLPVFLIYHVHLSLGGIADRLYWCLTGYLMFARTFLHTSPQNEVEHVRSLP